MTQPTFVDAEAVRGIIGLNSDGTSRYSDETLGSNIRAATAFLERRTHRYFANRAGVTLTFTTNGAAFIALPGFRTVTSVQLAGAALEADATYWLTPDDQQTGVYTGIQLRGFRTQPGTPWYLSVPTWFDRGLDLPRPGGSSLPNDLVVAGDVGYADDDVPEEARDAVKILAAFKTKRPDALLSGGTQTPDGSYFDLSRLPIEVKTFIESWSVEGVRAVIL